jgi:hypothetical protein
MMAECDGRSPTGAHVPRTIGFRPMQCSSIAPDFNSHIGMLPLLLVSRGLKLFLSAERSSSLAASGWPGCWIEWPMVIRASHPGWTR